MTKGGPNGNPDVEGLTGKECNTHEGKTVCVNYKDGEFPSYDPNHGHEATTETIFDCRYSYI
jgi:hypothetical protein